MHKFDFVEFCAALAAAKFNNPVLVQARDVFAALPEPARRVVVDECSRLAPITGCGPTTAFEIVVATARLVERERERRR